MSTARINTSRPIASRVTSGAKRVQKNDNVYISAWKRKRTGFLSILVSRSKYTKEKRGKNDKVVLTSLSIKVTNKDTGAESFHWGISDSSMSVVKVNGLGWVISTRNGGYVSTRPGFKMKGGY